MGSMRYKKTFQNVPHCLEMAVLRSIYMGSEETVEPNKEQGQVDNSLFKLTHQNRSIHT
jgi:hypothetical protein